MADPIPGVGIGTPYGARGSWWSCNENSSGDGVHTGCDFPCPAGTKIVAPIAGQVRHRSYGSAFGNHQFAISPDPGQPFAAGEVFFAHTRTRPADGVHVQVGDYLAEVGNEGNSSGPHLHYEYHPDDKGVWNCGAHADPAPTLDGGDSISHGDVYLSKLHYGQEDSDSVARLQLHLNSHPLDGGEQLPITGNYWDQTDEEVRLCQQQHGYGDDPPKQSNVGPQQAAHLIHGCGCVIHDDRQEVP